MVGQTALGNAGGMGGYGNTMGGSYGMGGMSNMGRYGGMGGMGMGGMGGMGMGGMGMGGMGGMGMGGMGMGGMGMGMGMMGGSELEQRSAMTFMMITRVLEAFGMFANVVQMVFGSTVNFMGSYMGMTQQMRQMQQMDQSSGRAPYQLVDEQGLPMMQGPTGEYLSNSGHAITPQHLQQQLWQQQQDEQQQQQQQQQQQVDGSKGKWSLRTVVMRLLFLIALFYTGRKLMRWLRGPNLHRAFDRVEQAATPHVALPSSAVYGQQMAPPNFHHGMQASQPNSW
jgi:hypothetical protein